MGGILGQLPAAPPAPEIRCGLDATEGIHLSTDGVVDLAWTTKGAERFELEQASGNPDTHSQDAFGPFELRYAGPDTSTVRSGLAEGMHLFRVRALDASGTPGPWSQVLAVRVAYMDRGKVRLLLILGAVVVVSTITVILHGHFTHRRSA